MLFGRFAVVRAKPEGEPPIPGPLKIERFRLANTGRLGDPGKALKAPLASAKAGRGPSPDGGGRRETRIPDGKVPDVGVEGNTLTDECGDRPRREPEADESPDGDAREALEVLEALECVCW